jgi:hypothetical protein
VTGTSSSPTRSITGFRRVTPEGTITNDRRRRHPSFPGRRRSGHRANCSIRPASRSTHDGNVFIRRCREPPHPGIHLEAQITVAAPARRVRGDGGPATAAWLHRPSGRGRESQGEHLTSPTEYNHRIRLRGPATDGSAPSRGATDIRRLYDGFPGRGATVGDDGPATEAFLNFPPRSLSMGTRTS